MRLKLPPFALLASLALSLVLGASEASAEAPRHAELLRFLYGGAPRPATAATAAGISGATGRQILAEQRVAIDFGALDGSPRLPLLDQRVYDLVRTGIERRGAGGMGDMGDRGDMAWRGKVVDPLWGDVGTATLTLQGDLLAGLIVMPDAVYEIEPTADGEHRLIQVGSAIGTCAGAALPDVPARTPMERRETTAQAEAAGDRARLTANAEGPTRLDILVVWTPEARVGLGGTRQVRLLVQNAVDVANTSFINSRVDARLNLVHAREVNFPETGNPETDLLAFQRDRNIAALRKSVGADLVSLFVNQMIGACGIGFLMTNDAFSREFQPWTYSVVKRACGSLVLAHEVGHNMSCNHDRQNSEPEFALFPYAFGFISEGQFRTVMAYGNNCSICPSVENFSNPEVTRGGLATGVAGQTDNARALNNTRELVSTFETLQPCKPGPNNLCLLNKRFRVELFWENQFNNTQGTGAAVSRTDAAGFFTFGDPSNIELMVKMLDFGDAIKVFYGQLTNLKFSLIITDTVNGASKVYENTAKECGAIDQSAFNSASSFLAVGKGPATLAAACRKDKNNLCLLNNRFQVSVAWRNPGNNTSGVGGAVPISGLTGAFYFTDASNLELMVKAIDLGDRIDIFYGTLSDLEYTITVTDTVTGGVKTYLNPAGNYCGGLDGNAFPR